MMVVAECVSRRQKIQPRVKRSAHSAASLQGSASDIGGGQSDGCGHCLERSSDGKA